MRRRSNARLPGVALLRQLSLVMLVMVPSGRLVLDVAPQIRDNVTGPPIARSLQRTADRRSAPSERPSPTLARPGSGTPLARATLSMHTIEAQLPVLVTASTRGEILVRELAASGVSLVSAIGTLTQLRRSLVRDRIGLPVVLCITLDDPTIRRYGQAIAQLLEDRRSFTMPVHAIGVMMDGTAGSGWQELGCDALTTSPSALISLLAEFEGISAAFGRRATRALDCLWDRHTTDHSRCAGTRCGELRRIRPKRRNRQ